MKERIKSIEQSCNISQRSETCGAKIEKEKNDQLASNWFLFVRIPHKITSIEC